MARSMQTRSRFARRRGVLLLVVMAVLVMFLVITLTYVLVASKAKSVGKALAQIDKSGDPPNFLLDECAMLLFRGTNDPHCPFATWSLLEGMYGNVSFRGTIRRRSTQRPPAGSFSRSAPARRISPCRPATRPIISKAAC